MRARVKGTVEVPGSQKRQGSQQRVLHVLPEEKRASLRVSGLSASRIRRKEWAGYTEGAFPSVLLHLPTVVAQVERHMLEEALRQVEGNRNEAARLVGLSRASFYRKLKSYGLLRSP